MAFKEFSVPELRHFGFQKLGGRFTAKRAVQILSVCVAFHLVYLVLGQIAVSLSTKQLDVEQSSLNAEWSLLTGPVRIGILSSYPPQLSDVGEYTRDLYALGIANNSDPVLRRASVGVVIVDDKNTADEYGGEVTFLFRKEVHKDYIFAAEYINRAFDVLSVQHDFTVYGGHYGELLLVLLDHLTIPYVVNIHSLPADSEVHKRMVLEKVLWGATRVTVPLPSACPALRQISPPDLKCSLLPYGRLPRNYRPAENASFSPVPDDRRVILTPGLVSPIRGVERMMEAMKGVRVLVPKVMYVVLGAQEPGQSLDYMEHIRKLGKRAGVSKVTTVIEEPQSFEQLVSWFRRAEVIVDPSDDPTKISSRSLSMALALGIPAVASAFPYAEHLCGPVNTTNLRLRVTAPCAVTPINSPRLLAMSVNAILRNVTVKELMLKAGLRERRADSWQTVAKEWSRVLTRVAKNRTHYVPGGREAWGNRWPLWPGGDAARQAVLSSYGAQHKGRAAMIRGQLMAEDVAREVLFGTSSGERRLAAEAMKQLTFGPLRFSSYIPRDEGCEIIRGPSGMSYTHNGIGAFHSYALGADHVLTHTLPTKELILGRGVRYGGMFVNLQYQGGEIRTRVDVEGSQFRCQGDVAEYVINTLVNRTTDQIARIATTYRLLPGGSVMSVSVRIEALSSGCLERVEVILGMDSMSSWFPGLIYDRFYLSQGVNELRVTSTPSVETALYQRGKGRLPSWSLLTNSLGDFGVVTLFRNQSMLTAVRSNPDAQSNYHYVRSEYVVDAVCKGAPAVVEEEKILLARVDIGNVQGLGQVVSNMSSFVGFDISGPSNRALVEDALEELEYHKPVEKNQRMTLDEQ